MSEVRQTTTVVIRPNVVVSRTEQGQVSAVHSYVGLPGRPGNSSGGAISEETFTGQSAVTVAHNRGYRPIVAVSNLAGEEVDASVHHTSLNSFTVSFNVPQSGHVSYF